MDATTFSDSGWSPDAEQDEEVDLIPAGYVCEGDTAAIRYPGSQAPFVKPDRIGGGPTTRAGIIAELGGIPPRGNYLSAASELRPGDTYAASLFASRGEDIPIHFASAAEAASYEDRFLSLVALVDYQPVTARYVVWNDDRTEKLLDHEGTGLHYPVTDVLTLVDIILPEAAFPEDRRYEVSLFHKTTGVRSKSDRIALYYNGFEGFEAPCMTPVELQPPDAFEEALHGATFLNVIAHPTAVTDPEQAFEPIHVSPGEEVPITLRLLSLGSASYDYLNRAFVPLLDGEPIGEPFFLSIPTTHDFLIPYRQEITITAPEEPGIHEFILAEFFDPFIPPEDHRGEKVDGVYSWVSSSGSTTVTLVVDEPAP